MYKPLPKTLTIKESAIHGLGLFAKKQIVKNTDLGITHILNEDYEHNYIRTPLGGFINHSDTPNAKLIDLGGVLRILTIRLIEPEEEIKVKYKLYKL